jgi:hypothetical protein
MIWTLVSPRVPKVRHLTMHLPYDINQPTHPRLYAPPILSKLRPAHTLSILAQNGNTETINSLQPSPIIQTANTKTSFDLKTPNLRLPKPHHRNIRRNTNASMGSFHGIASKVPSLLDRGVKNLLRGLGLRRLW